MKYGSKLDILPDGLLIKASHNQYGNSTLFDVSVRWKIKKLMGFKDRAFQSIGVLV